MYLLNIYMADCLLMAEPLYLFTACFFFLVSNTYHPALYCCYSKRPQFKNPKVYLLIYFFYVVFIFVLLIRFILIII